MDPVEAIMAHYKVSRAEAQKALAGYKPAEDPVQLQEAHLVEDTTHRTQDGPDPVQLQSAQLISRDDGVPVEKPKGNEASVDVMLRLAQLASKQKTMLGTPAPGLSAPKPAPKQSTGARGTGGIAGDLADGVTDLHKSFYDLFGR